MTDFQRKQIRELRMRGVGYRAIASVIGVSRDAVRNYCKANRLDGYVAELTVNMKEQMQQGKSCLSCGKTMKQPVTGRKRKFCSETCRREWWTAHQDAIQKKAAAFYEKTCIYCGERFTSYGNKDRKYCKHDCYIRDRFWRVEEGRGPYIGSNKYEEINA